MIGSRTAAEPRSNASDEGYLWDRVATCAMGRYLTGVEVGFILRNLGELEGSRRLAVDAGAGSGRLARLLAASFDDVVATEARPELVRALATAAPNVTPVLVEPSSEHLPVLDESADAIISVQAADLSQAPWFYQECMRVLRPGGRVIVTMQNRRSWKGGIARMRQARYRAEYGAVYYTWSLSDIARRARDAGLEIERAEGYNWLPFSRLSDNPIIPAFAKLERWFGLRRLPGISPWVLLCARRPDA